MATQAQVRRIALSFPDTIEVAGRFAFAVKLQPKPKEFAWVWMERVDPKKARVANPAVLAVQVPTLGHRETLIAAEPAKFFTEPHYAGYPAVLVRLAEVTAAELRTLLEEAWRCRVEPKVSARSATPARRRK